MINGAKHEIEGGNHDKDGAKCQVVKYFVVLSRGVNHNIDRANHIKYFIV